MPAVTCIAQDMIAFVSARPTVLAPLVTSAASSSADDFGRALARIIAETALHKASASSAPSPIAKRQGMVSTGSEVATYPATAATAFLLEMFFLPALYVASICPSFILRNVTEYRMKNLTELGYSCTTFTKRVLMRNVEEKMCHFPVVLGARLLYTSISGPAGCVVLCVALRFLLWTLRYLL